MRAPRGAIVTAVLAAAAVLTVTPVHVQGPRRTMQIAARGVDEVRQWSALVDQWSRDGGLRRRTEYADADVPGRRHEALVQFHQGVPVLGGDLTVQRDRGVVVSVFGTVHAGIDVDTTPALSAEDAVSRLEAVAQAQVVEGPTLVVAPTLSGGFALAYRAALGNGVFYLLDANRGEVLFEQEASVSQSSVGQGRGARGDTKKLSTTFTGGTYRTLDALRPAPIVTLDTRGNSAVYARLRGGGAWVDGDVANDADNDWSQAGVVDLHSHMGMTYDYFFKNLRYQGLDNRNSPIVGTVASRELLANNALFTLPPFGPNGRGGIFFGETNSGTPMSSLDVVAHEMMHAVTHFAVSQRTGNTFGPSLPIEAGPATVTVGGSGFSCPNTTLDGLRFLCSGGRWVTVSDHAGAMNEGLSDVFGTATEFAHHPAGSGALRAEYTIGEDIESSLIRSLQNPAVRTVGGSLVYPDHYGQRVGFAVSILPNGFLTISRLAIVGGTGVLLSSNDGGGVHINSGILSHAYYLAIEGGTNRTSGRAVQGVGVANRGQIEQVFFRAIRDLFPSAVTFPQAGIILRQSASDLHGASSAAARAVDQALAAVGL